MLIASDETQNKPERTRLLRLARNPSFVLLFPSSNPIQRNLDDRATTPPPIPSQSLNRDRLNPLKKREDCRRAFSSDTFRKIFLISKKLIRSNFPIFIEFFLSLDRTVTPFEIIQPGEQICWTKIVIHEEEIVEDGIFLPIFRFLLRNSSPRRSVETRGGNCRRQLALEASRDNNAVRYRVETRRRRCRRWTSRVRWVRYGSW